MKYVLFVCTHNAGTLTDGPGAVRARTRPRTVRAESAGSDPTRNVWPEVIEVMREVDIDLSDRKPKRLSVEMQLHADWAVTMGCGDVCPYVPTRVDDWDIPDPAGRPVDEVREIRDMIDERVSELATTNIDAIRSDETSHRWRLAKLLPELIEEFGETRDARGHPSLRGSRSSTITTMSRSVATSSRSRTSAPAIACATRTTASLSDRATGP